jgi:hypothetical protein
VVAVVEAWAVVAAGVWAAVAVEVWAAAEAWVAVAAVAWVAAVVVVWAGVRSIFYLVLEPKPYVWTKSCPDARRRKICHRSTLVVVRVATFFAMPQMAGFVSMRSSNEPFKHH